MSSLEGGKILPNGFICTSDGLEECTPVSTFPELLQRACAQDETAATELVQIYEPELLRYVRFRLTDPTVRRFIDSLDVCQSVLATFFIHLRAGTLRELPTAPRQLAGMLAAMAKNKVVDKVRKSQAERRGGGRAVIDGADPSTHPAPGLSPDDLVAGRELIATVRGRLAAFEREVLDRWLAGDDWPTIAAALGVSSEAVRKRFKRAVDGAALDLGLVGGDA